MYDATCAIALKMSAFESFSSVQFMFRTHLINQTFLLSHQCSTLVSCEINSFIRKTLLDG